MISTYDAVVIGAGIVGAACACELARAGMRTAIVEASIVGGGATAAGMGHIVVMDDSPAQLALTQYSQSLWNEIAPQLPANVEYDRCGTLWIAADDEEMQEVRRKQAVYASVNVRTEVLDSRALSEPAPSACRRAACAFGCCALSSMRGCVLAGVRKTGRGRSLHRKCSGKS